MAIQAANQAPTRYIRVSQILGSKTTNPIIPVSHSYWYAGVKSGKFPRGIKLSPRVTVWKESDILALVDTFGAEQAAPQQAAGE